MSEEKCEFYNKGATFKGDIAPDKYCLINYLLINAGFPCDNVYCNGTDCYYKQLQAAKDENEKLFILSETLNFENQKQYEKIQTLTQQNKQMREALEKIANQTVRTQDTLCNLKLDSCTNDCKNCFQNIAKQALGA